MPGFAGYFLKLFDLVINGDALLFAQIRPRSAFNISTICKIRMIFVESCKKFDVSLISIIDELIVVYVHFVLDFGKNIVNTLVRNSSF